ncbi:FHA domain-containing protein [Streptomyces sp. NPDC052095]|uniref:FHA domain-containing protein n=1 Tax=unclassified Streptomyces TaxID=2593676 RepID=UPI00344CC1B0
MTTNADENGDGDGGSGDWDDWGESLDESLDGGPAEAPCPVSAAAPPGTRCRGCTALLPPGTRRCPRCLVRTGDEGHVDTGPAASGGRAVLRFDGLALSLPVLPGEPLRLGRDADWAPASAEAFKDLATVSRRHASVSVGPDGAVWVTEEDNGTRNGTWVNGVPLLPGEPHRLRDGDRVGLGRRVDCTVRVAEDGAHRAAAPPPG